MYNMRACVCTLNCPLFKICTRVGFTVCAACHVVSYVCMYLRLQVSAPTSALVEMLSRIDSLRPSRNCVLLFCTMLCAYVCAGQSNSQVPVYVGVSIDHITAFYPHGDARA